MMLPQGFACLRSSHQSLYFPPIMTKAIRLPCGIAPAVPVAELDHHVAGVHYVFAVIQQEHALAFEEDAVIDGFGFMHGDENAFAPPLSQVPPGRWRGSCSGTAVLSLAGS